MGPECIATFFILSCNHLAFGKLVLPVLLVIRNDSETNQIDAVVTMQTASRSEGKRFIEEMLRGPQKLIHDWQYPIRA